MPQSFWNVLFEVDDRDSQWRRELDNHYHAQMLLTEVQQFTGYTQELVKVQSGMIAENWGKQKAILTGIHAEVAAVRQEVGGVRAEVVGMRQEVRRLSVLNERMVEGIAELNATHREIASELANTNRTLARIAEALENPLGTKARELRREACHWLEVGRALPFGRARPHYADATRLLEKVVQNSIGR